MAENHLKYVFQDVLTVSTQLKLFSSLNICISYIVLIKYLLIRATKCSGHTVNNLPTVLYDCADSHPLALRRASVIQ